MPNFPIVDTHLHLWDLKLLRYPWLENVPLLNKSFRLEDYRRACGSVQVSKMVFVQCECDVLQYFREVEWVYQQSRADSRIRGMVAWAPIEDGKGVEPSLDEFSSQGFVKGIRRIIQFESDIGFCLRPDFVRGVQLLARYGLTFDLCISHGQMPNVIKLVRQCPNVKFMLDHIGKPSIKTGELDPWRKHLQELATMENVWCKLSGLVTEAHHTYWSPGDLQPYIDHVIDCFGFDRIAFGGDWPVAIQATDYHRWVNVVDNALSGASAEEQYKIYVLNGEKFYGI